MKGGISKLVLRVAALVLTASALTAAVLMRPKKQETHRYQVRQDLSVYFSNADKVIDDIRAALVRRDEVITISYVSHSDNMADIDELTAELMEFALSETDKPYEGDYLRHQYGGYEVRYGYSGSGGEYDYEIKIYPDLYTDPEMEAQVDSRIAEIKEELALPEDADDYTKFRAVYDYIYQNVSFDKVHQNNPNNHLKTTCYSALIYKNAVCQGYAVTLYRLLREYGVPVRVVTGYAEIDGKSEYHAWNIVRIDELWYNVDLTWDKELGSEDFCLVSDSELTGHIRDPQYSTEEFCQSFPMSEESYVR